MKPLAGPKLEALLPVIDAILAADGTAPVKQRHTAERIFEHLRDEHGCRGLAVLPSYVLVAQGGCARPPARTVANILARSRGSAR